MNIFISLLIHVIKFISLFNCFHSITINVNIGRLFPFVQIGIIAIARIAKKLGTRESKSSNQVAPFKLHLPTMQSEVPFRMGVWPSEALAPV